MEEKFKLFQIFNILCEEREKKIPKEIVKFIQAYYKELRFSKVKLLHTKDFGKDYYQILSKNNIFLACHHGDVGIGPHAIFAWDMNYDSLHCLEILNPFNKHSTIALGLHEDKVISISTNEFLVKIWDLKNGNLLKTVMLDKNHGWHKSIIDVEEEYIFIYIYNEGERRVIIFNAFDQYKNMEWSDNNNITCSNIYKDMIAIYQYGYSHINLWDFSSMKSMRDFEGLGAQRDYVSLKLNENYLVATDFVLGTIRIWDRNRDDGCSRILEFGPLFPKGKCVVTLGDERLIVRVNRQYLTHIYDLRNLRIIKEFYSSICFLKDNIIFTWNKPFLRLYSSSSGSLVNQIDLGPIAKDLIEMRVISTFHECFTVTFSSDFLKARVLTYKEI
jgi:hypothetical protein